MGGGGVGGAGVAGGATGLGGDGGGMRNGVADSTAIGATDGPNFGSSCADLRSRAMRRCSRAASRCSIPALRKGAGVSLRRRASDCTRTKALIASTGTPISKKPAKSTSSNSSSRMNTEKVRLRARITAQAAITRNFRSDERPGRFQLHRESSTERIWIGLE